MADDFDRTRGEGDRYRSSRSQDRLGVTGQTRDTHAWPSWINWALPLAALAGLLWYLTGADRTAHQSREPVRTTTTGGTTTGPGGATSAPSGTNTAPSGTR